MPQRFGGARWSTPSAHRPCANARGPGRARLAAMTFGKLDHTKGQRSQSKGGPPRCVCVCADDAGRGRAADAEWGEGVHAVVRQGRTKFWPDSAELARRSGNLDQHGSTRARDSVQFAQVLSKSCQMWLKSDQVHEGVAQDISTKSRNSSDVSDVSDVNANMVAPTVLVFAGLGTNNCLPPFCLRSLTPPRPCHRRVTVPDRSNSSRPAVE